jgi:hypothetical protein
MDRRSGRLALSIGRRPHAHRERRNHHRPIEAQRDRARLRRRRITRRHDDHASTAPRVGRRVVPALRRRHAGPDCDRAITAHQGDREDHQEDDESGAHEVILVAPAMTRAVYRATPTADERQLEAPNRSKPWTFPEPSISRSRSSLRGHHLLQDDPHSAEIVEARLQGREAAAVGDRVMPPYAPKRPGEQISDPRWNGRATELGD